MNIYKYIPNNWNTSALCYIHKKGDTAVCANYRAIRLLNLAYTVLSTVLCGRFKPIVNKLIGPYLCAFRPGKFIIYQIFTIHQILEKTLDKQIDPIVVLSISKRLSPAMTRAVYSTSCLNLVSLGRISSSRSISGFRPGDSLSCLFFNIMLEKVVCAANMNRSATVYSKSTTLLGYAYDIDD